MVCLTGTEDGKLSTDLVISPTNYGAMSVHDAVMRRDMLVDFTRQVMTPDVDYGMIPGTQKNTLLKPGAEKLCSLFGLTPRPELMQQVMDWTGTTTGGEPLFYYRYRYALYKGDHLVAEAEGSCNSFEKKYRFRNAQRICPTCGQPAIFASKQKPGWFCWNKKGGCGATFSAGNEQIEKQETGQVANPDIFDTINTIEKMAQKRALVAATLLAVNASEFFTQDMEDFIPSAEYAQQIVEPAITSENGTQDHYEVRGRQRHTSAEDGAVDEVNQAAEEEAARRQAEADKAEEEAVAERKRVRNAAYKAFAKTALDCGFAGQGKDAILLLARIVCRKDEPDAQDWDNARKLRNADWNAAIDKAHEELGLVKIPSKAEQATAKDTAPQEDAA